MTHSQIMVTQNLHTKLNFVHWIKEKLYIVVEFQKFSRNNTYVRMPGKLSKIHFNCSLFSNQGDYIGFLDNYGTDLPPCLKIDKF